MAPDLHAPKAHPTEGSSSKLSYVFAFAAAVFIVSGDTWVAVFFGLMAAMAVALTIGNLPRGGRQATDPGDQDPADPGVRPGGSASSGIDA